MSQDKERFIIIGRGTTIRVLNLENRHEIRAFYGDQISEVLLGAYKSEEAAQYVLKNIYDSIGEEGAGKYILPNSQDIENKIEVRRESESEYFDLDRADLSVRTFNCLKRAGYKTMHQLILTPESTLGKIRNMGPHCIQELHDKGLTREGYLSGEADEW